MEKLFTIDGVKMILNIQFSKIGYSYPRLFIEVIPNGDYLNLDLSIGRCFTMPQKDWLDWLEDAEEITDMEKVKELCSEYGLKFETLSKVVEEIKQNKKE